ncbi:aldehyde dehydrogenase family protein [Salinisphaera aquimarina]|uniref:Aldehyde dehydrogenase family protein n=1 Tax=Salinisphaera aquimarina TaxID=2094031 RepID=A0ABV7ETA6_9GAMM
MGLAELLAPAQPRLFIGGGWCDAADGATFDTRDPAHDDCVLADVARGGALDIDAAVTAARAAWPAWAATAPADRSACLRRLADAVEAAAETLATIEVLDNGKSLTLARAEVAGCVAYLHYYAGAADKIQGETVPLGDGYLDYVQREPLGVSAHIVPWNAPLSMLCRSLAPALAAGNTAVVKPAEQTPLSALKLAQVLADAGLPNGVFNVVTGFGSEAGAALAAHAGIDSITFTGSVATGRAVLRAAAEHVKPVVVELGGKSPQLVFADAGLEQVAREVVKGIFTNSGQYCDAGSRLLVEQSVAEPLCERVVGIARELSVGPGLDAPDLGPLVSREHFERVCGYMTLARQEGARALIGGAPLDRPGCFVPPTIYADVSPAMRIYREEIFGPVLTVTPFADEDEALALANDCDYGLAAGVFTADIDRALRLASRIEAGYIMVNEYFAGGIGAPFGGCKLSGYSRERGLVALENYTRTRNVVIRWKTDR